ncbi:glycoside hydrolase family 3 protein [Sphingomonas sp. CFBP 8760]|uniref:glycoside hydrolase family 3 protein n=1 Tax=Sphingomonas sp. CFBP 8760 TaxID=2775282 RepID=UPI00177ADCBB|nr:glycoside hydrolase family 3 protein [Sphingomonas sp. CFBP 8760]MBD8546254.1 glycoside hydrolase family 3 protein [Sphingomonas sp. CFBP 8760]
MTPIVAGIAGPVLTAEEADVLARIGPAGIILFARNVADPAQLCALTDSLRDCMGRADLAVLIDQEGGPVARLRPPHWPDFPAAARFAAAYDVAPATAIRAMHAQGQAIGRVLAAAGITMNCAPLLDIGHADTDPALVPRLAGHEPLRVAALGRAMLGGMAGAGVTGIVKHLPGLGRATVDPHHALPIVTAGAETLAIDAQPFRALAHARAGMTAHVVYAAWDAARPATLSPVVIDRVIRGTIGFDGLLVTDDLHMGALSGDLVERAVAAIAAGCDLALCCHATPAGLLALATALPALSTAAHDRLTRAYPVAPASSGDMAASLSHRDAYLAATGAVRLAISGKTD